MIPPERILALSPHTDDVELGAGGSVARWCAEGREVHYLAFSACESSVPDGFPSDVLRGECRAAAAELGVASDRVRILGYEVRRFGEVRQQVLQTLVDLDRELQPDLVLVPALDDLHQDHAVIALEGLRAFKRRSVLAYDIPWNTTAFRGNCLVRLREADVERKLTALQQYRSQAGRPYMDPDFTRGQLRFRGGQVGTAWAEAFEVVRWSWR